MWGNDSDQIAKMLTVVNLDVENRSNYFHFMYFIFSNLLKWKQKKSCLCMPDKRVTDREKGERKGSKSKF